MSNSSGTQPPAPLTAPLGVGATEQQKGGENPGTTKGGENPGTLKRIENPPTEDSGS